MTNKKRGTATIMLDKSRTFKYTLNAIAALEDEGIDIGEFSRKAQAGTLKSSELRFFIWAGLAHEDKDLTIERVGDLVDFGNLEKITRAITDSLSALVPDVKKKEAELTQPIAI